ncbi:HNH endonuclease [Paenibacillus dokdonensis]|uniref:HNH endonuclease n=1 Tax=Paenibacillus dokdonensis TaxID=2567944 RepID=A0ABU6GYG3_9BACL|nr:HNH endonuclease [Paenibacillus dokdonensis]MEC0244167.1 HNH endonuclease [Paenibacillus dokdonensis]
MNEEFDLLYDCIVEYRQLNDTNQKRIVLSEPLTKQFCRFCGESAEKVNFRDNTHIISETLGNKILFSDYECSRCNKEIFGSKFEDALGKYVLPLKLVSEIYGKKTSLIDKDMRTGHRIEYRKNDPILPDFDGYARKLIIDRSDDKRVTVDNNEMTIQYKRQKYNPVDVYYALLKMSLTLVPFEEVERFMRSLAALQAGGHEISIKGVLEYQQGFDPFNGTNVQLFRRKQKPDTNYPYMVFKVSFGNFSIQIPVFTDEEFNQTNLSFKCHKSFKDSLIRELNFENMEPYYSAVFSVLQNEFNEDQKQLLAEELKKNGYLRTE